MKIALIGYGRMGKWLDSLARKLGIDVVSILQKQNKTEAKTILGLQQADVWLDFSHSMAVLEHVKRAAEQKKNLLIGTTGWEEELPKVRDMVIESGIGCLFSPNFSMGVLLFYALTQQAARLAHRYGEYEAAGWEVHHSEKKDSPSGTAKALHHVLQREWGLDPISPFASVRCGHEPGTHTVLFSSSCDTISLTHEAHSREGFAKGALFAAEWLCGKKGFFTIDDLALDFV